MVLAAAQQTTGYYAMADTGTIRVCECHPNADTGPAEGNEGLFSEDTCERDPLGYPPSVPAEADLSRPPHTLLDIT